MFNAGNADGTCLLDMKGKGTFSYQNDERNYVRLDDETRIFIERINTNVARVYLVNNNEEQVPLRSDITMVDADGEINPPFNDTFFITWADSYTLRVNDEPFMRLCRHKQQGVMAPRDVQGGKV